MDGEVLKYVKFGYNILFIGFLGIGKFFCIEEIVEYFLEIKKVVLISIIGFLVLLLCVFNR